MSTWTTVYKGHKITVENSWMGGERLWVNGTLQDEQLGWAFRSRLYGSIRVPGQETKRIKVSLGTPSFSVECRIFVDDELVFSGR
ncbi:hypothetical protein [uncultured Mucilaginibacter sp.]|uniref:hypothetical protein n=1 Tax=uncultured Mucilaginibacter sp. TaxID=797541 RepID=UPI0025FAA430|nr:hypothetical protein [uncultured Mucilaginibacter sp.]